MSLSSISIIAKEGCGDFWIYAFGDEDAMNEEKEARRT